MNSLEKFVKSTEGETRDVLEKLVKTVVDLSEEQRRAKEVIAYYKEEIRLLRKRSFGASSEKLKEDATPSQSEAQLFNEFELCSALADLEAAGEKNDQPSSQPGIKKRAGRKALPKDLPREVIEHDLSREEKICPCGKEMACIGAQVSEQLHYKRAEMKVIEHRCKRYGCADCNQASKKNPLAKAVLKTVAKPPQLIPKSIATHTLLTQIVVQKFCDHLPLYRQEQIFKRYSVCLSRQTMSEWMLKIGVAVIPVFNVLQEKILDYSVAYADETTVQVLNEPGRRAESKSYMWCFLGGPPDARVIIYQYHDSRKGDIPKQFFADYQGALHCDGYSGYSQLLASSHITGINCMAHVRRKFIEALPNKKEKGISGAVVRILRQLYKIEESLKTIKANPDVIKQVRQEKAKPILEALNQYLKDSLPNVPPKSKIGEAIKYTLTRWRYLVTYLEDGRYEIDNNRSERAIKPFVMGRKAWLFANSIAGAHTSARLFSLIETAKANELDPLTYLSYLFEKLPTCKCVDDYEALFPWNVKARLSDFKTP